MDELTNMETEASLLLESSSTPKADTIILSGRKAHLLRYLKNWLTTSSIS